MLLAGVSIAITFSLLPLTGSDYWLAALLLVAWYWLLSLAWPQPKASTVLFMNEQGYLQWQQPEQGSGQLHHRSLITTWLLIVVWQDDAGKMHKQWLFCDQLAEQDYRAVARAIQLQRWRKPASEIEKD